MKNKARELFYYYDEHGRRGMKTVIGEFVSNSQMFYKNGELISIEEANSIDRVEMAKEFVRKRTYDGKYKIDYFYNVIDSYSEKELLDDIAILIDSKIPLNYFIKLNGGNIVNREDRRALKLKYKGLDSVPGMKFWYEVSSEVN